MATVLLRLARLDALHRNARFSHQTFNRLKRPVPMEANGEPLSERILRGSPRSRNNRSKPRRASAGCAHVCGAVEQETTISVVRPLADNTTPSPVRNCPL